MGLKLPPVVTLALLHTPHTLRTELTTLAKQLLTSFFDRSRSVFWSFPDRKEHRLTITINYITTNLKKKAREFQDE